MRSPPTSVKALLIQAIALVLVVVGVVLLRRYMGTQPSLILAVIAQGITAAVLSVWRKLPPWWVLIQLIFLPAILAALWLNLPAKFYFIAFLVLLLFYWSTFRTQVPLYLSGRRAWQCVAEQLPVSSSFRFIDLGSGVGGLPLYLASVRLAGEYHGIEVAPAPWLISRMRALLSGSQVQFHRKDYGRITLADYDVVFVFLSPAAMDGIWRKAQAEMRSGTLLLSLSFPVPDVPPSFTAQVAGGARHVLYGWRM
ncbi:MAG: class I SAM-dependent methyltransferase [Thiobacillaceae bacterium]